MPKSQALYALLVAIDKYPIPHHRLNGCVNDRNAFADYLQRRFADSEDIDLKIKLITDEEATKKQIIAGFDHFNGAKDGDICVFYYSGHGSRAMAPREFWPLEPDRMVESVVCWDSRIQNGKDLMDKELSYLFWKATNGKKLHFLTVFDCCHSGTITKAAGGEEVRSRMAEPSPAPVTVRDYVGFDAFSRVAVGEETSYKPPRGRIIQLGASKDQETAKELRINGQPRGIFTYNLIEMLEQTGGIMTYEELVRVLQVRIENNVKEQTPQLITLEAEDGKELFLGGTLPPTPPYFRVDFAKDKWVIDAGSIQGIPESGGILKLEDDSTELRITSVGPNRSEVEGMKGKDPNKSYRANVVSMSLKKLKLAFAEGNEAAGEKVVRQEFKDSPPPTLELVKDRSEADFIIRAVENTLRLTKPNDERPIFRRVAGYTEQSAAIFLRDAEAVAQWKNLINLSNPRTSIGPNELELELYQIEDNSLWENDDATPAELLDWRKPKSFQYDFIDGKWVQPAFRLRVRNKGQRTLYLSGLYLQSDFLITNKFLKKQQLEPGEEVWLLDSVDGQTFQTIPVSVRDEFHSWGVTEIKEFIKIIASTDPQLSTDNYIQSALEMDVNKVVATKAGRVPSGRPAAHDWTTREIELTIVRPMEKQQLSAGGPAKLADKVGVQAPTGLSAKISLAGVGESARAVFGEGNIKPPTELWGHREAAEPFEFTEGTAMSPGLSVVELSEVEGKDAVSADSPLVVNLDRSLSDEEMVVPVGYDAETGLYLPLGFSTADGDVFIESLPDETPTGTRSLGGSIKIYFQKVLSKIGIPYDHPRLAMVVFNEAAISAGVTPDSEEVFTYETDKAKVQAAVAGAERIGLFIHGIIGDTLLMPQSLYLAKDPEGQPVIKQFDLVLTFDYENLNTLIQENAKLLGERLAGVGLGPFHGKQLTIMAHSMGGLVSRWFIEKENGSQVVSRLIQFGTPNAGSPWSNVYEMASILVGRVVNGAAVVKPYLAPLSFLGKLIGQMTQTLEQMHPEKSEFLQALNDGTDPGIPYTIVAGNTTLIPLPVEEKQRALLAKLLSRFRNRGHYDALYALLFKTDNDIAVSVDSIGGIAGAANWQMPPRLIPVGCDHLSYFVDPEGLRILAEAVLPAASVAE